MEVQLLKCEGNIANQNCNSHLISDWVPTVIIILHSHPGADSPISPNMLRVIICFSTPWHTDIGAINLRKVSYYSRSVILFISIDGTSRELSTHKGTLLVITTFTLKWLTERNDIRMDGLQNVQFHPGILEHSCKLKFPCVPPLNIWQKLMLSANHSCKLLKCSTTYLQAKLKLWSSSATFA